MSTETRGAIDRLLQKAREAFQPIDDFAPAWRDAPNICALADAERHLGHAVRVGENWIAYDAIHFNPANDGFRVIGIFQTIGQAKQAIEDSVKLSWLWAIGGTVVERNVKIDLPKGERPPEFETRRVAAAPRKRRTRVAGAVPE